MILIINTNQSDTVEIILAKTNADFRRKKMTGECKQSEKLLVGIEEILKKEKIKISQLKGIVVVKGPGGFTSLRIGVAVANALGYASAIPVAGVMADEFFSVEDLITLSLTKIKKAKKGSPVLPEYGREPNINLKSI